MDYRIIVNVRAQKEIEDAISFYDLSSDVVPINYIIALKETYTDGRSLQLRSYILRI